MQDVASTVYAGVDTHKDKHVLCLLDGLGRRTFVGEFPADADGYDALARAIGDPGTCPVVGVEGTASFGAGLTDRLQSLGFNVLEVLRPKRDRRRRGADKNDAVDAELAARHAAAGDGTSVPKSRDGWVEAVRPLVRARDIAVRITTETSNAAKSLVNTAPERIRARYSGMGTKDMMRALSRKREESGDPVADALMLSLRAIARTWREQDLRAAELETQIVELGQGERARAPRGGGVWSPLGGRARDSRRRQPGAHGLRGGIRLPVRRVPHRGVQRKDGAPQAQPRREQEGKPRAARDCAQQDEIRRQDEGLRREEDPRRQIEKGDHALPQALCREGGLPCPAAPI